MKVMALTILLVMFFWRIKNTPAMLSKEKYEEKIQKLIDKNKESLDNLGDYQEIAKSIAIVTVWVLQLLFIIFYIMLGTKLNTTYMMILSSLQVFTCVYSTLKQANMSAFSKDIEDFPFYRWYCLFNVILDYMYYPVAIYMLLMK